MITVVLIACWLCSQRHVQQPVSSTTNSGSIVCYTRRTDNNPIFCVVGFEIQPENKVLRGTLVGHGDLPRNLDIAESETTQVQQLTEIYVRSATL